MKLNFFERLFIISPIRPLLQKHLEARQLLEMGGSIPDGRVLEIGCGPGSGIDLIYDYFMASSIDAFDVDPEMVFLTRKRHLQKNRQLHVWVGKIRYIPVENARYDAVLNFGVIHHVRNWRPALGEIYRVLKPGGKFYCEEILSRYITHPIIGKLMDHPQDDRFNQAEFIHVLRKTGFRITKSRQLLDLYLWIVATKLHPTQ